MVPAASARGCMKLRVWQPSCLGFLPMKIALASWHDRVSPVFDVSKAVLLVEAEQRREVRREERSLVAMEFAGRARELAGFGADVLICGAISAPLRAAIEALGIEVFAFVCGPVEAVLAAYLDGGVAGAAYVMPGCRGAGRGRGGGMRLGMFGQGGGRGRGGGAGGGTGGRGRMGGPFAGGPGGECVCPDCGARVPHPAGQPCTQLKCPKCGSAMVRA